MALACPECGFDLKPAFFESSEFRNCQICGSEVSVLPFPACFAAPAVISAFDLQRSDEETSCYHHESRKAVKDCSRCGKFLCALCVVEVGSSVLCPECLVAGEHRDSDPRLERWRVLYDSVALALAILPAMTFSFSILGAPAAIYTSLRYWRRPTSIVRRFAWRKYAALLLGLVQIGFWVFILVTALTQRRAVR